MKQSERDHLQNLREYLKETQTDVGDRYVSPGEAVGKRISTTIDVNQREGKWAKTNSAHLASAW